MTVRLSSQDNLGNNTESGLSFENKTYGAGARLRGSGRVLGSALKRKLTLQMKVPETFRCLRQSRSP